MKDGIYISIIGVLLISAVGGFFYLNNRHASEIEKLTSQISGQRSTLSETTTRNDYLEYVNEQVTNDYNKLVKDYNSMLDIISKYVNYTSYQPRQTISCNSYTYGGSSWASTSLNCY